MVRAKACNACRQLKLRCDAHEAGYTACTRCRKMGRECVVSTSFKRQKRRTKAELQQELETLRSRVLPMAERSSWNCNINQHTGPLSNSDLSNNTVHTDDLPPENVSVDITDWTSPQNNFTADPSASFLPAADSIRTQSTPADSCSSQTVSRTLGDVKLSARKIDGCFSMFSNHYASAIPGIFDYDTPPNDVYEYSILLFWTIVYVGSRKYSKDPTIIASLTDPLKELAQRSLFDPDHAIPTIQATLIICLWQFPVHSVFKDQTHVMAGAAMQLAIQKGLPYSSRKQDFVRVGMKQSEADKSFQAQLWAYCVIVFQSVSFGDGYLNSVVTDPVNLDQNNSILNCLPPAVLYQYRLHLIQMDAMTTIVRTTDLCSTNESNLLNSLINHFDTQAQQISCAEPSDSSLFVLQSVRLYIRAFHFFSAPNTERTSGILQAYFLSCELIETASRLDKSQGFGEHCSQIQIRAVALAAVCILRAQRSSLKEQVDPEIGEDMVFEAIRMSKKHSIQDYDLNARNATILTQLWPSTKLFKFKDGSVDGLRLLLRGRLSMSIMFDLFWWWRAEFGGKSNPYMEGEANRISPPCTGTTERSASTVGYQDVPLDPASMNQRMLTDLSFDASEIPDWNLEGFEETDLNWY